MHFDAWHWQTIRPDESYGEESRWHLFAREVEWKPRVFDTAVTLAAEDKCRNVMVLGLGAENLYMPYDGGADVIARDGEKLAELKREFVEWVSPRAEGEAVY